MLRQRHSEGLLNSSLFRVGLSVWCWSSFKYCIGRWLSCSSNCEFCGTFSHECFWV